MCRSLWNRKKEVYMPFFPPILFFGKGKRNCAFLSFCFVLLKKGKRNLNFFRKRKKEPCVPNIGLSLSEKGKRNFAW